MPPMNETNPIRHDGLIGELLAFHRELLRHRASVEAAVGLPDPVAVAGGAGEGSAAAILGQLEDFLRRRSELARRRLTDLELLVYREAQYVMAALADDLFLHEIQWPGRDAWRQDVLEFRLFGTRVAGERFFENIKTIVQGRGRREMELAPVYLLAIGLGFRGQHRASEDAAILDNHAAELFHAIRGRRPDIAESGHVLVKEGYANVVAGLGQRRRWPALSWPLVTAVAVAGFLVLSTLLWLGMTGGLAAAADAAIQAAR
jgi:type VI secretion system protein ImpK